MKEVVQLICFINDLTDELFSQYIEYLPSRWYYTNSGCYEFAKIIKHFIPEAMLMMNHSEDHVALMIGNGIYDSTATEETPTLNENLYRSATQEDINRMEDFFGIEEVKFEGKAPSDALIQEMHDCSGTFLTHTIDQINRKRKMQ